MKRAQISSRSSLEMCIRDSGDTEVRTIDIEASRAVEDNPLFYHNVYTRGDKKIGYLVYNHFTPPSDRLFIFYHIPKVYRVDNSQD